MSNNEHMVPQIQAYRNARSKPSYTAKGSTIPCPVGRGTVDSFYLPMVGKMNLVAFGLHYTLSVTANTSMHGLGTLLQNLVEDLYVEDGLNHKVMIWRDGRLFAESCIIWNDSTINDTSLTAVVTTTAMIMNVDVLVPCMVQAGQQPWLVSIEQGDPTQAFNLTTGTINSVNLLPTFHYSYEPVLEYGCDHVSVTLPIGGLLSVAPFLNTQPSFLHIHSHLTNGTACGWDRVWPYNNGDAFYDDVDILDGQGEGMRVDGRHAFIKFFEDFVEEYETIWPIATTATGVFKNSGFSGALALVGLDESCLAFAWEPPLLQGRTIRYDLENRSATSAANINIEMFFARASASRDVETNLPTQNQTPVPEQSQITQIPAGNVSKVVQPPGGITMRPQPNRKNLRLF